MFKKIMVLFLLLLAMVLAGCAPAAPTEIKIGLDVPMTGDIAYVGTACLLDCGPTMASTLSWAISLVAAAVEEVVSILANARLRFPDRPLHLGCMRPRGKYRAQLDPLAVQAGINRIVSPAREAVQVAEDLGLSIVQSRECCVF